MADVIVKFDQHDMNRVKRLLTGVPNGLPKVLSRGINKTAKAARTQIVRLLAAKTGMKQKTVRSSIRHRWASYRWLSAWLGIFDRGMPLSAYKARRTQKGVSYALNMPHRVRSSSKNSADYDVDMPAGRNLIEGAFIATMPTGHKGVFIRKYQGDIKAEHFRPGKRVLVPPSAFSGRKDMRMPILELYSSGLAEIYENAPTVARPVQQKANKDLRKNVFTQVRVLLDQKVRAV